MAQDSPAGTPLDLPDVGHYLGRPQTIVSVSDAMVALSLSELIEDGRRDWHDHVAGSWAQFHMHMRMGQRIHTLKHTHRIKGEALLRKTREMGLADDELVKRLIRFHKRFTDIDTVRLEKIEADADCHYPGLQGVLKWVAKKRAPRRTAVPEPVQVAPLPNDAAVQIAALEKKLALATEEMEAAVKNEHEMRAIYLEAERKDRKAFTQAEYRRRVDKLEKAIEQERSENERLKLEAVVNDLLYCHATGRVPLICSDLRAALDPILPRLTVDDESNPTWKDMVDFIFPKIRACSANVAWADAKQAQMSDDDEGHLVLLDEEHTMLLYQPEDGWELIIKAAEEAVPEAVAELQSSE